MPLTIIRNDITKIKCDAIVNAANTSLRGGGGVDGAIHRAAGDKLLQECRKLGGCRTGEAKITHGYMLPAKYVIHTVGPIWQGGNQSEEELLCCCYRNSLGLAREYHCKTIAFPLISSGAYGYPKEKALQIAIHEIRDFLQKNDMDVTLVIFDKSSFAISKRLIHDIVEYLDDKYIEEEYRNDVSTVLMPQMVDVADKEDGSSLQTEQKKRMSTERKFQTFSANLTGETLSALVENLDESFSQMLLRKIEECNMTDVECYKRANISRKHFSKIRSNPNYRPSKTTVLAFAIALRMNLEDTKQMLQRAGFALTHSSKFDIIIEYFIVHENYDIFEINDVLFEFDQCLIGLQ